MYIKGIAFEYGFKANQEGRVRIPALDKKFLTDVLADLPVDGTGAKYLKDWLDGWDKANLRETVFVKGGNVGKVMLNNGEYIATTATKSQWFKTLAGAQRFMNRNGYTAI